MTDLSKIIIRPDASIRHALEVIQSGAVQTVYVCDQDDCLLGVATDGDIRRGLLNGCDLSDKVSRVCNTSPIFGYVEDSVHEIKSIMKKNDLKIIPILDAKKLVDIYVLTETKKVSKKGNVIFLMAGGFGRRLMPLTANCPKPMLKIAGKPILEHIILHLKEQGFYHFVISVHYLPEVIMDYFGDGIKFGVNISYVMEGEPSGTAGALSLYKKRIDVSEPMIVMNADIITTMEFSELLDVHNDMNAAATVCLKKQSHQIPYGVVNSENNIVVSIEEKPINEYFINAGIYVITQAALDRIKAKMDMPTLLQTLIQDGLIVATHKIYKYWADVGKIDDLNAAGEHLENLE